MQDMNHFEYEDVTIPTKEVIDALNAIAQGYPITVADDRYIVVENPDYMEDRGDNPYLLIDVFNLDGKTEVEE